MSYWGLCIRSDILAMFYIKVKVFEQQEASWCYLVGLNPIIMLKSSLKIIVSPFMKLGHARNVEVLSILSDVHDPLQSLSQH